MKKCPFCAQEIQEDANVCRFCNADLVDDERVAPGVGVEGPAWNRGVAAALSLVIPGAGQMYKGQILNGLVWLFVVIVGYALLIVPGVLLHFFCIVGAASDRSIGLPEPQPTLSGVGREADQHRTTDTARKS